MMSSPALPDFLAIGVAHLVIGLTCNQPEILQPLRRLYRDFASSETPKLLIELIIESGADQPELPLEDCLSFQNGNLVLAGAGCSGLVDLRAGIARIMLHRQNPAADLDYLLRVIMGMLAQRAGGLLIHAAGIERAGKAHVFLGVSGSGKTTVSRFSAAAGLRVLNDDLLCILPEASGWRVHATPFWNPTQVAPHPGAAPLAALYRLVKDSEVYLERISLAQGLAEIIANIPVVARDAAQSLPLLATGGRILAQVPLYRLHFRKDPTFWEAIAALDHPD